jgi:hypothetical protein
MMIMKGGCPNDDNEKEEEPSSCQEKNTMMKKKVVHRCEVMKKTINKSVSPLSKKKKPMMKRSVHHSHK